MGEWREYKLANLGRIVTGKTPPTSNLEYYGADLAFVTPSDMDGRRTIDRTARFLTQIGAAKVKSSFITEPAIIVSCIGSDMGKAAIVNEPFVSNQQINSIIVSNKIDRLFVYYNLSVRKEEIRHKASGAAQPIMNKTDFGNLVVRLPNLSTQRAISGVLSALDDKIELNRQMNATLESMAQALFRDWFVDFGPVRRKLDGATDPVAILGGLVTDPEQAAQTAAIFPDSFGNDGLPEGWEERAIYDFAKVVYGAPFKSKQFNSEKRGRPLARIRDLPKHEGGNYTEEVHPREHLIEPGDIVVGMDGEFRAYVWQGKSTLMNQRVCSFVAHNKANRAFVWLGIQPQLFANENSARVMPS